MFNKLKKTNGITLIALIISVIVLLILAGVAINVTVGENGVLTQATTAVKKNKKAKVLEDVKLAWTGIKADYYAKWAQNSGVQFSQIVNKIVLQKYLEGTVNSLEKTGEREYTLDYTENDKEESRYIILLDEEGNAEFSEELIIPETLALEITNGEEISKESKTITATLMNLEEPVNWNVIEGDEKISLSSTKGKEIIVTAESEGEAIIQATCGKHTKKCTVTVNVVTPIRSIDSISGETTINLNDEFPETILTANVTPIGATESSLIWESLNEDIAIVTNVDGRIATITGNSVGTATIKVSKRGEEETVSKTIDIEVIQPIPVTGIVIKKVENEEEIELSANETITMNPSTSGNTQTKTLKAYVVPTDASNKNITWSIVEGAGVVSLPSSTTLESGTGITVTAGENAGLAILKATSVDGNYTAEIPITIHKPLSVGDLVEYKPEGKYIWNLEYAALWDSGCTRLQTVSSGLDEDLDDEFTNASVTSWRVFSIDEVTRQVELVPATINTSTNVRLQSAQGYNNAVTMLNDACSSLYSNVSKGITARSINIEDIERILDKARVDANNDGTLDWKKARADYKTSLAQYGKQSSNEYTKNRYYPVLYGQEINSVINGTKKSSGLGMSEKYKKNGGCPLIRRTDLGANNGHVQASKSIQPFCTYYYFSYSNFSNYLGGPEAMYVEILLPDAQYTHYWVASRCVRPCVESAAYFEVRAVNSGTLGSHIVFESSFGGYTSDDLLFPVVTLNSEIIEPMIGGGYEVKL